MIKERIDRSQIERTSLDQAEVDDVAYWMHKSPDERIEAVEYQRRWVYSDDQIDARLQRVLTTARLGED